MTRTPPSLRVRTDPDSRAWRSAVDNHPLATPFHTLAWRRAVARAFGYVPRYRLVVDGGDGDAKGGEDAATGDDGATRTDGASIVAAVPGFACPARLGRDVVNPFCEYGFPLLTDGADPVAVLDALADAGPLNAVMFKDADWTGITGYNLSGYGAVATGITRRLSLGSFDAVRDRAFDRSLRSNVQTAREAGVTVRESDDVDAFHRLYLATMRRHGSPQFPAPFLAALRDEFGDDCRLLIADRGGEAVAGLLVLDHGSERYLFLNGSEADALEDRPNDLLYWTAIERACDSGVDVVDFGRTDPGSGVARFKRAFGGRVEQMTTLVAPAHRSGRADVTGYRSLAPLTRRLSPLLTHPAVGPRLKEWVHE